MMETLHPGKSRDKSPFRVLWWLQGFSSACRLPWARPSVHHFSSFNWQLGVRSFPCSIFWWGSHFRMNPACYRPLQTLHFSSFLVDPLFSSSWNCSPDFWGFFFLLLSSQRYFCRCLVNPSFFWLGFAWNSLLSFYCPCPGCEVRSMLVEFAHSCPWDVPFPGSHQEAFLLETVGISAASQLLIDGFANQEQTCARCWPHLSRLPFFPGF